MSAPDLLTLQRRWLTIFAEQENKRDPELLKYIKSSHAFSAEKRLAVYKESIKTTLMHTLLGLYKVCEKIVGKYFFEYLAKNYINRFPPLSTNLNEYGEFFAEFLKNFLTEEFKISLFYLADLSNLEWIWHEAHDGPEPNYTDFSRLNSLDENNYGEIIFELVANAKLLFSAYHLLKIWEFTEKPQEELLALEKGDYYFLVWRFDDEVKIESLTYEQYYFLKCCQEKQSLKTILENAAAKKINLQLDKLLAECVTKRWLQGFRVNST